MGALEPQESRRACWIYNRVTQSLSQTLFSGGNRRNRAGFVQLRAGVLTSLDPSLQGDADCHCGHWPSLLNLPASRAPRWRFFLSSPHQRAAEVGRGFVCVSNNLSLLFGLQPQPWGHQELLEGTKCNDSFLLPLLPTHILFFLLVFFFLSLYSFVCLSDARRAWITRPVPWQSC